MNSKKGSSKTTAFAQNKKRGLYMDNKMKKRINAIGVTMVVLLLGAPATFFVYLSGMFGMFPLYVTKTIPVIAAALMLSLILTLSGYLSKKSKKRVLSGLLLVFIACGGFIAAGAHKESVSKIDDRDFMLYRYEPYDDNTKAVYLSEESTLKFDYDERPRLDGATALYPVYAGFVQAVYPEAEYHMYDGYTDDGYGLVTCSNTVGCYERLIKGETDIIFVAGPSKAQLEMAEEAGMELHMTPIGKEAFVFFVNKLNPVDSLTIEDIQGIYSGKIKNWKAVGGKNQSIRAFQRDENSGSQTGLQKLMGDIEIMEPKKEDRIEGMGGIIREVAAYRNYKNALGFSYRYYATTMDTDASLKLLAINGVEPTKETIRDGSYPIASEFYAITASPIGQPSPQETNENIAAFLDWILSEQGQQIIEETGYVSLY